MYLKYLVYVCSVRSQYVPAKFRVYEDLVLDISHSRSISEINIKIYIKWILYCCAICVVSRVFVYLVALFTYYC